MVILCIELSQISSVMGYTGKLVAVVLLFTTVTFYVKIKSIFDPPEKPQVDDIWWGPGDPSKTDTSIRPFKINIPDSVSKIKIFIRLTLCIFFN